MYMPACFPLHWQDSNGRGSTKTGAPTEGIATGGAAPLKPRGYLGKKPFVSRYIQGVDGFYYRKDRPLPPPRMIGPGIFSICPEQQKKYEQQHLIATHLLNKKLKEEEEQRLAEEKAAKKRDRPDLDKIFARYDAIQAHIAKLVGEISLLQTIRLSMYSFVYLFICFFACLFSLLKPYIPIWLSTQLNVHLNVIRLLPIMLNYILIFYNIYYIFTWFVFLFRGRQNGTPTANYIRRADCFLPGQPKGTESRQRKRGRTEENLYRLFISIVCIRFSSFLIHFSLFPIYFRLFFESGSIFVSAVLTFF